MPAPFAKPAYPALVEEIIRVNPNAYRELVPKTGPTPEARKLLETATLEQLVAGRIVSRVAALGVLAGLWLWNDGQDECHQIVQEESALAYWHAIVHRREPDYSNAKYWFHRVGRHPVFAPLAQTARTLCSQKNDPRGQTFLTDEWDPFRFVDLCQQAVGTGSPEEALCREVQRREWELLFDYYYRQAMGLSPAQSGVGK
jgi:hypothetical protein